MNGSTAFRRTLAGTLILLLLPFAAEAQTSRTKAPPRLPANPSQSSRIPAGVDTGSPATSGNVPLGTPVPPDPSTDRAQQRTRSAAARAAARPDPLTRTGAPLAPAKPLVGAAVIHDASRPAALPPLAKRSKAAASAASSARPTSSTGTLGAKP